MDKGSGTVVATKLMHTETMVSQRHMTLVIMIINSNVSQINFNMPLDYLFANLR